MAKGALSRDLDSTFPKRFSHFNTLNTDEGYIKWEIGNWVTIYNKDARDLSMIEDSTVHLVVTSPPYNVGTNYNSHSDNMPLEEYLILLDDVWKECWRLLVPGGRICVNVPAGSGRSPYIPIAGYVREGIQKRFSLRGVIVWDKGTSGGRTSWGSYRLPSNPTLRDTTERIIIANKGKPGQGMEIPAHVKKRDAKGVYSPFLENGDLFRELTQDHWQVSPESKTKIKHPAPFPVAIPERLIRLYAFPGAKIMDPFSGSGTTGVAAIQLGCQCILVDIDYDYCKLAVGRCYDELNRR
jgi:site-specific DNA-methyltransferase (adenine-specific)